MVVAAVSRVRVPDVEPVTRSDAKVGDEVVAISWGKERVIAPVESEATT